MANFVLPPTIVVIWFLVNVRAAQVPTPPAGVNVTRNGSHSIVVEWNAMPNVFEYHVYYQKKDVGEWRTKLVPGNQTSLLIDGLMPYMVYLVKIKANTTNGLSNFSVQVQATTDEATPSALPKITEIRALDCCSIYLRWDPISAEHENGVLLGYRVYYLKKADMNDYKNKYKKVFLNITLTRTNVTHLHPYTEYFVGVAAYNSKGVDENLATIANVKSVRTLEGAPSAPSGLTAKFISSSELVIQWVLIPEDKANGVLLGYRYVVYDNKTQVVRNGTVSNSTNSTQITNMKRCADYSVHLRAWTAAGPGMDAVFNITNICASPKIINLKSKVILTPHTAAVLYCNYTGFPTPAVTWILSDRAIVPPGKGILEVIPPHKRYILNFNNGSLSFTYVFYKDKGLYTCFVNNSLGSAEANTTVTVRDTTKVVFIVNLTNEHFHDDLLSPDSSRFKRLSSTIKVEVLRLYSNTTKANIEDVVINQFGKGSVLARFRVIASAHSGAKLEDAKYEMLSTMIAETKDGKLGEIPVGQIIVEGAPFPPDAKLVSNQPTYAVLSLERPPFYKQYQISSYSILYRKHAEPIERLKTGETVEDKDGTMKGVVKGLEPGQSYFVQVTSRRNSLMNGEELQYKTLEVKTPDIMMKQVLLTIVLPIGLAIIIAVVILFCIRPYVRPKDQNGDMPLGPMLQSPQHYGPREENLYDIGRLLEEFPCRWKEIPREDVTVGKELGAGAFGTVVRADLKRNDKNIPCAVKMLKRFATEREHRDLFNELSIMSQVGNHTNIVSLIGACTVNGPLWVVVKIAEGGCLLDYLHKHRKLEYSDHAYMNVQPSTSTDDVEKLDKLQKLKFAHGIARGMKHLEKMKCVHRDLAARNVLLGKSLVPMVSDFGLSRDIYESGMYEDVKGGKRPVRWMAPESIEDYTCTTKSDVWSYGVTVWEIETAGTVPYAGVDSGMDILNEIKRGYRLEQPADCDDEVYEVMLDTWRANPLDRPSFMEIDKRVEDMLAGISEYLEIQNDEDDDMRVYDEVHISEQELANGHITQDDDPDHGDAANERVRYTDIQGATASDVPMNNPTSAHDGPLEIHQDTSRDHDDDANERVRYTDIQGATASDVPIHNPTSPRDGPSRDQEDDTSLQTKC